MRQPTNLRYLTCLGMLWPLVLLVIACQSNITSQATSTPLASPVSPVTLTATATPTPPAAIPTVELVATLVPIPQVTLSVTPEVTADSFNAPTGSEPASDDPSNDLLTTPLAPLSPSVEAPIDLETPAVKVPLTTEPITPEISIDLETPPAVAPPDTSDPLFIESLRQHRDDPPPTLEIVTPLAETADFTQYQIAYTSDGLRITGVMNVPKTNPPDTTPPFPVILLNHGYYNPASYTPGTGTQREADYLAVHGYVTFASDYRGYAGSEGDFGGHFDPGWTYDILDLLDALPSLDFVDPERVGMWGHSTGGEIALRVIIARDSIDATVLFGSMGADAADNFRLVQGWGGGHEVVQRYGTPEEAPEVWAKLSPMTYLADVSGPISIHHGELDGEVPPELSVRLWEAMQAAGRPGEYYTYPDQHHVFQGEAWTLAMERTVTFFDQYVKSQKP